jgi:pimeloyl-ACP methyl ester carboxylesterase
VPNAGHAPFLDNGSAFNRRLGAFADEVRRKA